MNRNLLIGLGIVAVLAIFVITTYNGLVSKQETVTQQWAQVENVYQRRSDLIPNLVNTVKGGVTAEKDILEGVMNARAKASQVTVDPSKLSPDQIKNFQGAQDGLSSAIGRLMVVVEKYPDLQSIAGFSDLRASLEGSENRIAVERKKFNEVVQTYNVAIRSFPGNLFGFEKKGYFEASQGADKAPTVQF
jgi:LemA protein